MWYDKSFRRNLIDMHIPDWNPEFMSTYDPEIYAELIKLGHIDTTYIYAGSCLGNCYWPTKAGHMHSGLQGRDIIGRTIKACTDRDIRVVLYFNIWSLWAYHTYPDWRIVTPSGKGTADYLWTPGHYGVLCPNSPYRDYVVEQVKDLCENYDFAGMWFDMNFWPYTVCYCRHCANRWAEETGQVLPRTADWNDPDWLVFQKKRQDWLAEFTQLITDTAKQAKPGISVCHQCGLSTTDWTSGVSQAFFDAVDYMGGDFYRGFRDQSFICRLMYNLSNDLPYDYMVSRCPDLSEHTTAQEPERIHTHFCLTLANNGANFLIDAIDPDGSLDRRVYESLGSIYRDLEKYEKYIDPKSRLLQDAVIYFNYDSVYDFKKAPEPVVDEMGKHQQVEELSNVGRMLLDSHIPYGVITDHNIDDLENFKLIILPDFVILTEHEAECIAEFVRSGGGLLVSRGSGIFQSGRYPEAAAIMSEVLGLRVVGETDSEISYLAPTQQGSEVFVDHIAKYPMALHSTQLKLELIDQAEVLAKTTLAYTDPKDPSRFASAISNPPGACTDNPAVVVHKYGNGKTIYIAGAIEHCKFEQQRQVIVRMLGTVLPGCYNLLTDAPKVVQVTAAYHDGSKFASDIDKRCVVNLVNAPDVLPAVPVHGITVSVKPEKLGRIRVLKLPEEELVDFEFANGYVTIMVPVLDVFAMYAVDTMKT